MSGGDIGAAAGAIEKVGTELCQSLASLAPKVDNLVDASPGARSTAPSELEDQLCTLRKTMEDTKAIVFEIQAQLGQGRAKEGTKLDDIARLLGALDMRLHMLEDRQRLDSSVGSPAVGSAAAPKRGNAGSTKVRVSSSPPRDLAGRAGQLVVHCLTQYPLMIIGALLVILVSELLVIGGIGPDMQSVRELGRSAVAAIRNHIGGSQPPT
ncbi:hypothetical protein LPJ61_005206 [Coemansia biformis]|uniref:Uncharacterized protein n=1 Tax=Coemansia biformis TaxID=1286918 RepID=A0A9W7Y8R5_9FUNG|nr:hypothetical protein LPJ61_005206 [Coemansia biformis]